MVQNSFANIISPIVGIPEKQVDATLQLLDEKATIPFIARYRKEKTGSLDEVQIADIAERYTRLMELSERKQTILKTIEEQGKLTPELKERIEKCWDATEIEDIYLPYKPHRKTRADLAIERGLEPLAKQLMRQQSGPIRDKNGNRPSEEDLQGARDIIAEWISQDEKARNAIRREFSYSAVISTKPVKEKQAEAEAQNYRDYFAVSEPYKRIASHRLLAIRRAEKEGYVRVDISPDKEKCLDKLAYIFLHAKNDASYQVELAMEDSYKRLLKPSIETEFAASGKEKADTEAIRVFAENLRQLLLDSPPLGQKRVLALDPGFRAGMLCYLLENRKFTKTVGAFAEWVAEYIFRNQMELWGEQMEQELCGALDAMTERGAASSLLALLPKDFTTTDLIRLRARKNQSVTPTSINSLLCRWRKLGRIDKTADAHWHRLT